MRKALRFLLRVAASSPAPADVLEAEASVLESMRSGQAVSLAGSSGQRTLRGEFLASLLSAAASYPPIRIANAVITGPVDLSGATVAPSLTLRDCTFDDVVTLDDASLKVLRLPACRVRRIEATNVHVTGALELNEGFICTDAITLVGGRIGGDLRMAQAVLGTPSLQPKLDASVAADAADETVVSKNEEPRLVGEGLNQAPQRTVLFGSRLTVGGAFLAPGLVAHGQIRIISARVGGLLSFEGAHFSNPGSIALQAERVEVGESLFFLPGFKSDGRIYLLNASISGGIDAAGSSFSDTASGGPCVNLVRAKVGRNVSFKGASIVGGADLHDAVVGGVVSFDQATFERGATSEASLDLARVRASRFDVKWDVPPAAADFSGSRVQAIVDAATTWPDKLRLDRCVYGSLEGDKVSVQERLRWLRCDPDHYLPHPYDQLVGAYKAAGEERSARRVGLEKERQRRATLSWPGKLLGVLQDWTVGYGYRPWVALLWMVPLVAGASITFATNRPNAKDGGPDFHPVMFAVDLLLPIVDFGYSGQFLPDGNARWVAALLVISGWALTTAVAAGVTRQLSRS